MDIREALLEEHSKSQCRKIVDYVGNDKKRFRLLMEAFLSNEYRITQRAGWPLSEIAVTHPSMIGPYFAQLVKLLKQPDVHNAVLRNITRVFQVVSIPKKYHGEVMTLCFEFIGNPQTPIAVKAFSLTILENFLPEYPDIGPEMKLIIEERFADETPAFKSRAKKILRRLKN